MRISRGRQHDWPQSGGGNLLAAFGDPALHSTGAGVRHQDDRAPAASPDAPAQRIHGEPRRRQRIILAEHCDQRIVAGVQAIEDAEVAHQQLRFGPAERTGTDVTYEHTRHRDMTPSQVTCPNAEIVLFTIALREQIFPQKTDRHQAITPEIDAEGMRARHVGHGVQVGATRQAIQLIGRGLVGNWILDHSPADS